MNNSSIFAAQFAAASLNSLVASFNHEVGNHGWCSARASYDHALIAEFLRRASTFLPYMMAPVFLSQNQ